MYNVKNYGAIGDGITDDAAAIQDAVSAANASGSGAIYFPSGSYLISGTGSISLSGGEFIFGEAHTYIKGQGTGYSEPLFSVNGGEVTFKQLSFLSKSIAIELNECDKLNVIDCRFDNINYGIYSESGSSNLKNIDISYCHFDKNVYSMRIDRMHYDNVSVRYCRFSNVDVSAITIGANEYAGQATAKNVKICGCYIEKIGDASDNNNHMGVLVYGQQVQVSDCFMTNFTRPTGSADLSGIYVKAKCVNIHDNTLIDLGASENVGWITAKGVNEPLTTSPNGRDINIYNNILKNAESTLGTGIYCCVERVNIHNNHIEGFSGDNDKGFGIIAVTNDVSICNNQIYDYDGLAAIRIPGTTLSSGSYGIKIAGNKIKNVIRTTTGVAAGIMLYSNVSSGLEKIYVENNVISNVSGTSAYSGAGVYVWSTSNNNALSSVEIKDNIIESSQYGMVLNLTNSTGSALSNFFVERNTHDNCVYDYNGTMTSTSQVTLTDNKSY